MDRDFHAALREGLEAFGIALPPGGAERLERYADRLLAWNRKVNLTAITAPAEVAEKHLVDSLLALRALGEARTLLDLGAGAGLPGIPLAIARPGLAVTCCDAVAKKVAFVKAVSAELDLPVRGVAARAEGAPEAEGLPRADAVISRAFTDPAAFVPLGARYLAEGGALLLMLGPRDADPARLEALGREAGLRLDLHETFELPRSRAARAIARLRRPALVP